MYEQYYVFILLGIVFLILACVLNKSPRDKVKANSQLYKDLLALNKGYSFRKVDIIRSTSVSSLQKFRSFSPQKYIKDLVKSNQFGWAKFYDDMKYNKDLLREYEFELNKLVFTSEEDFKSKKLKGINYKDFSSLEHNLYDKHRLYAPVPKVTIHWTYDSPKRRNHYSDRRVISETEFRKLVSDVVTVSSKEKFAKEQRAAVTPKLRLKILQRDNYRCCICGRSAKQGATLEVDHRIPVAKGGKSTEDNLWTLCFDCNRGKSDDIIKSVR